MTVRTTSLGGTDFGAEGVDNSDLNDTINAAVKGGMLGEVKMFALSITGAITKATLLAAGWAICDGTTPATQGISSPTITTTPDLQNKFIRMSDDETSGSEGGSDTHVHKWYEDFALSFQSDGTTNEALNEPPEHQGDLGGYAFWDMLGQDSDLYTDVQSSLPSYYELALFIKVKITA